MILDMTHGNLCLQIAIHWYLGMDKKQMNSRMSKTIPSKSSSQSLGMCGNMGNCHFYREGMENGTIVLTNIMVC